MNLSGTDFFGWRPEQYMHLAPIIKRGLLEQHLSARAYQISQSLKRRIKPHDFNVNWSELRNVKLEDDTAPLYSFVQDSTESINSMIQEILYRNEVYKMILPLQTEVDEGDTSYSYRIIDRSGKATWMDTRGTAVGSARVRQSKESAPLRIAGELIEISEENVRIAMKSGIPIQAELMEAAVQACLNLMNEVALKGDSQWDWKGFTNWDTTGDSGVNRANLAKTFSASTGEEIRKAISDAIGKMIADSKEVIPKQITGQLCVALTPDAFNRLTEPLGDNKDHSIESYLSMRNPWSRRTSRPIQFESLEELVDAGAGDRDRMVIYIKDRDVLEFPVAIPPRARKTIEREYSYVVPLEMKFGGLWIKKPFGVLYRDGT